MLSLGLEQESTDSMVVILTASPRAQWTIRHECGIYLQRLWDKYKYCINLHNSYNWYNWYNNNIYHVHQMYWHCILIFFTLSSSSAPWTSNWHLSSGNIGRSSDEPGSSSDKTANQSNQLHFKIIVIIDIIRVIVIIDLILV